MLLVYSMSKLNSNVDLQYALANSFILDSRVTIHVYNNYLRFKNLNLAYKDN